MTRMTSTAPGQLVVTDRTRHRRLREQGSVNRSDLDAILAAGFICHLGVLLDGVPLVVPTVYGATADHLYLHGSVASRSLVKAPAQTVCVTVTHVDGLVLARSVFEHGINYRSACIYGIPRPISDPDELLQGLRVLTEQCAPGQWEYARQPTKRELAATRLLALDLTEASVKTRSGPPDDADSPDGSLKVWAGVLPIHRRWGDLEPDPALAAAIEPPPHLRSIANTTMP
ncbi:pyridoxamine 5'-phosphate oxidase family protein (plasmid) [Mycolicibacterium psychrotolerans]|uniref:pyridoxamine 5'-phosphate oxidase family protein n=1 Tax=Mycolicibacterium psychrotolerans TaxID=216929 RepID=UPI003D676272